MSKVWPTTNAAMVSNEKYNKDKEIPLLGNAGRGISLDLMLMLVLFLPEFS